MESAMGRTKIGPICCSMLLALTAALPSSVQADGLVRDGVGAVSLGRGGTNLGFADNGAILLDNPAGMMNMSGQGLFDLSVDNLVTDINYSDPQNSSVDARDNPFVTPMLSYMQKSDDQNWALGIGAFAPAGFGAQYDMVNPIFGQSYYKSLGMLTKLLAGGAVRVTDRLSIGGTVGLGICHAELEGPFFLQTGALRGVPTHFDLQGTGAAFTGSIGLQYELTPKTILGVCYTSESRFKLDGSVKADVLGLAPFPVSSNFTSQMDIVWPRSLGVGIKHNFCDCHRVAVEVLWYDWSHAFQQFDIRLTDATNPLFPALLGPTIRDALPLNWHDTVSLRTGYEWDYTDYDTIRFGYAYHDSPVPENTLNPYVDGVLVHAFSLGYSRKLYRGSILSLGYQYNWGPTRHIGTSSLAGGDFDNSTFRAQAHWAAASIIVPF
jgi:long-chain fatty acid transport protein